jgi:hypothetical protein
MAQLDTRAPVGFLIEGATRGGAADDVDDERTGTGTVDGRRFPRHASMLAHGSDTLARSEA